MPSSHILVTGPHTVGKTSLIGTFITGNFQQPPLERGSEVARKVMTVERQEVEYEVMEVAGEGEGEELAEGVRLADTVLLCYRASDVLSLYEAVTKWLTLVRRHRPNIPIVLVGCQGDNKVYGTNTMLDTDTILESVSVVMHVETSATNAKLVNDPIKVAALASLQQKEQAGDCSPNPVRYAVPVKLTDKETGDKPPDQIYANLPGIKRDERDLEMNEIMNKQQPDLLQVRTEGNPQEAKVCKQTKHGIAIQCQRLNKNKVLEKINVEVSIEVFEALQQMNPNLSIKNKTKKTWKVLDFDSGYFCFGKSVRDVKTVLDWLRSLRTGVRARKSHKVTSL